MQTSEAPFSYFGGKAAVAPEVWRRFGAVRNYVEPFFGSGAVWLDCPPVPRPVAAVNDLNGYVANFWRATAYHAIATAAAADWPVNEIDAEARQRWLVTVEAGVHRRTALAERMAHDPLYCDPQVAGWWAWGLSQHIGSGWCAGSYDPQHPEDARGDGVCLDARKRPHIGDGGMGVHRRSLSADVTCQLPHISDGGQGVHKRSLSADVMCKRPHISHGGKGLHRPSLGSDCKARRRALVAWFSELRDAFRGVRVCCGDWSRLVGSDSALGANHLAPVGVFLDPPYSAEADRADVYGAEEDLAVAHDVRAWCLEHGNDPRLRIALCGYRGEGHEPLEDAGWSLYAWQAQGGYSNVHGARNANAGREAVWFSPHCLPPAQPELFDQEADDD